MPDGTRGPTLADMRDFKQKLEDQSSVVCRQRMDRAFRTLLRDTHRLGGLAKTSNEYRRFRAIVARDRREYAAACDAWVKALVDERTTFDRIAVSRKLADILTGALAARRDDPLTPISSAIRRAIDWMEHPGG